MKALHRVQIWLARSSAAVAALVLAGGSCAAQAPPVPPVLKQSTENAWAFSASAYTYFVPDRNYVQPTFTADHGWFHFETRYNYENLDTGSLWFGYNFSGGRELHWELTPIIGGVFGDTDGVAPGFKFALAWWKLELYGENEYVVDIHNTSESFFYNWSELTLSPVEQFRFGVVTQRTRAYQSDREIQRGVMAGVSFKRWNFTGYVFNPDTDKPPFVLAIGVTF